MNHQRTFFWCLSIGRGLLESLLLAAGFIVLTYSLLADAPSIVISMVLLLLMIFSTIWAGLRIRINTVIPVKQSYESWSSWLKQNKDNFLLFISSETKNSFLFSVGLSITSLGMYTLLGLPEILTKTHIGIIGTILLLLAACPGYLAIRVFALLWFYWKELRRTHFVWELTHTFLSLFVIIVIVIIPGIIIFQTNPSQIDLSGLSTIAIIGRIMIWTLTLLFFSLLSGVIAIVVILPPAAAFVYLAARRLTARIEALNFATTTLGSGTLGIQVKIEGEDEIAALQREFNNMSAALELSTRQLNEKHETVTQLLKLQKELTAGVSHELRIPVSVISGYIDSLRKNWLQQSAEVIDHDLEVLGYESKRLQIILEDMITLAQSEASRLSLRFQPVSMAPIIVKVVETLAPLAWGNKKVQVVAEIPSNSIPEIWADPSRMEQILVNLVQNAVRHTSPGGVASISLLCDQDSVCMEIADTGEGIRPENLAHIWEKFYRVEDAEGNITTGYGLGLSIVKEFTELMHASIDVQSSCGEGSVFILRFPIYAPPIK